MDVPGGAEALQAAQDGGAGEAGPVGAVDDLGVDGVVVVLVGFAHEDGEPLAGAFEFHRCLLSVGHSRPMPTPA